MKRLLLLATTLLLLFPGSCRTEPPKPFTLGVDLEDDFNHNYVLVRVDDIILFQDSLTTNHHKAFDVHHIRSRQAKGAHTIVISVSNEYRTLPVNLTRDEYIAISYNQQTKQFAITYSDHPFDYL